MRQALLVIDVQPCFHPPQWQVDRIAELAPTMHSLATIERHDEAVTPFWRQLGWKPAPDDDPLVCTDKVFVKHGYLPPPGLVSYVKGLVLDRILVCGLQADTCCLAAGFMLFDAGLQPTLLKWLTIGSSLDRSATLGAGLWRHHFGAGSVLEGPEDLRASGLRTERTPDSRSTRSRPSKRTTMQGRCSEPDQATRRGDRHD